MILGPQRRRRKTIQAARVVAGAMPTPRGPSQTIIPFDQAATFQLTGISGNLVQDIINVSSDGVFVAVALGYGLEEKRGEELTIFPLPTVQPSIPPGRITLDQIPTAALVEGFRVSPRFRNVVFDTSALSDDADATKLKFADLSVPPQTINKVFEKVRRQSDVSFMFSMVDSSSGRELQDEPTHNVASLGISNGERPFRPLAKPLYFMPRSTMRLQIEERSQGVLGTLFIVLYGYKILAAACPEPVVRSMRGPAECPTETVGNPSDRVIPFDYVSKFRLTGRAGNLLDDEVAINVEGGYVATAIGYGLTVEEQGVAIADAARKAVNLKIIPGLITTNNELDLTKLPLNLFPPDALTDGIRVKPEYLRFVFQSGGAVSTPSLDIADEMFERVNRTEDVSFRYAILDGGTGRELQNQPINNVAGLGIANGKRPFKQFVRPLVFLPRSTVRVTVEERFGRGDLYIVFQGYKILSAAAMGRS